MRNPVKIHRSTEANQERTQKVIEKYKGKFDLLRTWELQPDEVQIKNHTDIIKLKATVRMLKNLLLHRADAKINI